jgi:peptide/nickel transport system ATP-binding protein
MMYSGRIIELGATRAVFATPLHPYSHGLLRAIPSPEICHELVGMEGQPPNPGRRPSGCLFAPRCPYVVAACREARPGMVAPDGGPHSARCIRAAELDLALDEFNGLAIGQGSEHVGKTPTALLTVRDLEARYGENTILQDVNLEVPESTCVAVVGESGSGKTTLARCIIGLHGHWTGDIRLEGTELKALAKERAKESLRSVQYIFQNPYTSLNPRKTVGQIVEQPLAHYFNLSARERAERVVAALEDAALGGSYTDRYPDQLSGGERQRVAIARALSVRPRLLVCDEVTSALDVSVQAAVVELLRRLQAEHGLSLLFITHNLALVRSIAQHVVVLHEGRVVERGTTDDVLSRPSDEYTIRLLEDVPKITAQAVPASCTPTLTS